ncbi:MAG: HPr family phosphocarrier protein [Lachnospiraceae bacterium]|jgi:catabolite repression HPr-like protein|nr:HPr family phosphocarrier protein [Lachnospiraceae bacterium]
MTEKTLTIEARVNVDVSPLAMLVQVASQYESSIHFRHGSKRVNAKSIMGMMTMNFDEGEVITIEADGKDEAQAIAALTAQLTNE